MKLRQRQIQMQSNAPIGVFDSGLGGLSVFGELKKILPNENFIYFGDNANVPYGEKSREQLVSFSRNILDYFASCGVKMVLMACNTSSAVTLNLVKDEYDFDVLGLIEPVSKYLAEQDVERVGVIATSATINSNAYRDTILKYSDKEVFQVACPGLVEIVEEGRIETAEARALVSKYVEPLLAQSVAKIVLGCTHYPFLGGIIEDLAQDKDILINPAEFLAQEAYAILKSRDSLNSAGDGTTQFFTSKDPEDFVRVGKNLFAEISSAELLELNIGYSSRV